MDQKASKSQADELQKLFKEVQEHETDEQELVNDQKSHDMQPKIDVLNLPPRKEVHRSHGKKIKLKLSKPLQRLMFVIFILIIVMIAIYFSTVGFPTIFS
ncbi:MAG TPA: hypothetical protein VK077_11560 [Virgibacillus sp.]|nr:hypothetical protein [Virgibacillus sp.]